MEERLDLNFIVVYPDKCIQIYNRIQSQENHQKGSKCFSCLYDETLEHIRYFVYTCNCDPALTGSWKDHIKQIW
jgi:hypothetical protein